MAKKKLQKSSWFPQNIQTWITIGTLISSLFNFGVSYQLAPFAENIRLLTQRVEAIENNGRDSKPLVERFIQSEERIRQIQEDIKEIKSYLLKGVE